MEAAPPGAESHVSRPRPVTPRRARLPRDPAHERCTWHDLDGTLLWELSGTVNVTPTPFASHGLVFSTRATPARRPGRCAPSDQTRLATSRKPGETSDAATISSTRRI